MYYTIANTANWDHFDPGIKIFEKNDSPKKSNLTFVCQIAPVTPQITIFGTVSRGDFGRRGEFGRFGKSFYLFLTS